MRETEGYRPQLELLTDMFPARAAITVTVSAGSVAGCPAECVRSMVFSGTDAAVPVAAAIPRATAEAIFFEVPVGEKTTAWTVSGFMRAKLRKNPALRDAFCGIGLSDRCFRAGIAAGIASSRNACG